MKTIEFYKTTGPYGCFSNFSKHPIIIDDRLWLTVEHYFQAQKFLDKQNQNDIYMAKTPKEAAKIGRDRKRPLRPDWEDVKDDVMWRGVFIKFAKHKDILEVLLGTGNAILVEHTPYDSYWGDGGDGSGKNMLGKILMDVRQYHTLWNKVNLS